jgi:hypothetical protein
MAIVDEFPSSRASVPHGEATAHIPVVRRSFTARYKGPGGSAERWRTDGMDGGGTFSPSLLDFSLCCAAPRRLSRKTPQAPDFILRLARNSTEIRISRWFCFRQTRRWRGGFRCRGLGEGDESDRSGPCASERGGWSGGPAWQAEGVVGLRNARKAAPPGPHVGADPSLMGHVEGKWG